MIFDVAHHISPRKNFNVKDKGKKRNKGRQKWCLVSDKAVDSKIQINYFLLYFDFIIIIIDLFYYCRDLSTMQQSPEATVPTIMSKWSCYWSAAQRSALTQLRLIIQVKYTQVGALKKCKKSIKGLREF